MSEEKLAACLGAPQEADSFEVVLQKALDAPKLDTTDPAAVKAWANQCSSDWMRAADAEPGAAVLPPSPQEDAGKIAWKIIEEWQRDCPYPIAYEVRIDALAKLIANALRTVVLPPSQEKEP